MVSLDLKSKRYLEDFYKKNNIPFDYIKYDRQLNKLEKNLEKLLELVDETDHEVFLHLLSNFTYMSRLEVIDLLKKLFESYKNIEPAYRYSIFIPVSSFGGVYNGAINVVECFEEVLSDYDEITKKFISVDSKAYNELFNLDKMKNIVFIDDVIGSGDTFTNFIYRFSQDNTSIVDGRKLYLLSLFNLEKGIKNIEGINELEWDITLINNTIQNNIFNDVTLYPDKQLSINHKAIIKKYEKLLVNEEAEKIFIMGYKKSCILLGFYYNTPNNSLSVFWKENNNWVPLFPRKEDKHVHGIKNTRIIEDIKNFKKEKIKRTEFIKSQMEKERNGGR